MEFPSDFTPVLLAGLALCLGASLLVGALLVIAFVPASRRTVLRGLELLLLALLNALALIRTGKRYEDVPTGENKKPPL